MLLTINGGKLLSGEIDLQGSKNGALAILSGVIATRQKIILNNIPKIEDVYNFLELAKSINVSFNWDNDSLFIDASNLKYESIDKELVHKLRASIYYLSILSSFAEKFNFYIPGGCNLGYRPINYHLDLIRSNGGSYSEDDGVINISYEVRHSFSYCFPQKSVGGTVNALLLASTVNGVSTIENCAEEVEIKQLVDFLKLTGVDITELKGTYIVKGKRKFQQVSSYTNQRDRIAAASYLALGLMNAQSLTIKNVPLLEVNDFLGTLDYADLRYEIKDNNSILVYKQENNSKLKLTCQPWPGISSDILPIIVALFISGANLGLFKDEVYPLRTRYLVELEKLGLIYTISNDQILVRGNENLHGGNLTCTDLRGGMSMVIAALMIKDKTVIKNAEILLRGYENLFEILKDLGADIEVDEME